jgi:hypothetical protein
LIRAASTRWLLRPTRAHGAAFASQETTHRVRAAAGEEIKERTIMTQAKSADANAAMNLWIVEGKIDIPICIDVPAGKGVTSLFVALAGNDIDGFVELRPLDQHRATTSLFWNPVEYELRAGIRAADSAIALLRGKELIEHLADRLMLLTGYPVRPLSVGFVYNEDQLKACLSGTLHEYEATTGGEEAFRTQRPKNMALQHLLAPPAEAVEAIRRFRHAMSHERKADQFLTYYIALESIAKHVPGVTPSQKLCRDCGKDLGTETQENAAIKHLISRHPSLPAKTRGALAKIRARIVHGNADAETLQLASANLPLVQRLAADGIALVIGVDPASLNFLAPSWIDFMAPIGRATYSIESNPSKPWGGLLSDRFKECVSRHSKPAGKAKQPSRKRKKA